MPFTLLFDLDDTLLDTNMDAFIPAYFQALGKHIENRVPTNVMLRALVQGMVEAAVLLPDVTHYPASKLELVSAKSIREALSVKDGDVVTVSSAGYRRDITLTNAPLTVSFPVDGSSSMQFVGVHDGGGGITLGIRGPNQEFLMPIMSEGQALSLPVTN